MISAVNGFVPYFIIANGKKPLGGSIGKKQQDKVAQEKSVSKGKELRSERFKKFDEFLDRTETLANNVSNLEVEIKRTIFVKEDKPDEVM